MIANTSQFYGCESLAPVFFFGGRGGGGSRVKYPFILPSLSYVNFFDGSVFFFTLMDFVATAKF